MEIAIDRIVGRKVLDITGRVLGTVAHLLVDTEAPLRAAGAIDEIRDRFGAAAIGPASAVGPRGIDIVRKGARQWGPDQPSDDQEPDTR